MKKPMPGTKQTDNNYDGPMDHPPTSGETGMWITHLFGYWSRQIFAPGTLLRKKYQYFKDLLALDRYCLEKMAEIEEIHYKGLPCDYARVARLCAELDKGAERLVKTMVAINPMRYRKLREYHRKVSFYLALALSIREDSGEDTGDTREETRSISADPPFALGLDNAGTRDEALVGGKARNLSVIKKDGFPVPDGFCVTTHAFNAIVSANGLRPAINGILSRVCLESVEDLENKSRELRRLILDATVPDAVREEIDAHLESYSGRELAVRSSAPGEDGDLSFAGQHGSLLHVRPEDFYNACKQVMASKYTPRAITYRIHAGLPDEHLPMAVLVLEMVAAPESGVVYTSGVRKKDELGVYSVSGLGEKLVGGERKAREYFIDKNKEFVPSPGQPPYLEPLFEYALDLERRFGAPQDIEWAVDNNENLLLLQTRPLHGAEPERDAPAALDLPVLAKGEWASPGIVSGNVFVLSSRDAISLIPRGSIVVAEGLYPELTAALDLIGGVIAREGSAASHFATIARENGIPVVINIPDATNFLREGQTVTLDGSQGIVHEGEAGGEGGVTGSDNRLPGGKKTWLAEKMKPILETVSTLNLKDAGSEDFVPENCRSIHDLIRFVHEMGVREMFSLADHKGRGLGGSKVLELDIPLVFRVLNLEQGLTSAGEERHRVTLDDVTCAPFLAMFKGLAHEKIEWDESIRHFDWEAFDKVSAGVFNPAESPLLSSYGLLAGDYMHVLIRFGYHFVVVDALAGEAHDQNYIQFSFKGGGADIDRKVMRLESIRIVLEKYGFRTSLRGDLLKAEYSRESLENTKKRLKALGFVLGRSRLGDMSMAPEKIEALASTYIGEIDEILAV